MPEVFLVLATIDVVVITTMYWVVSRPRAVERCAAWGRRFWRLAAMGVLLMPVLLVLGCWLGCYRLEAVDGWLGILAGPLAAGDPWGSPTEMVLGVGLWAAMASLPLHPGWWTGLLAWFGLVAWCFVGFFISILLTAAGC